MKNKYSMAKNDGLVHSTDRQYVLRVRDMAEDERPREKLEKGGPEVLSSAELLAIVLTTGTKKEEVMAMSVRIMKDYGEKILAIERSPKEVSKLFDVPAVKACQIVACFELGRRFFAPAKNGSTTIRTARQAFEYLRAMGDLPKEHFRGLYLNSHYRIVHDEVISVGSLTASIVHPREVYRPAIEHGAAAIIVAHNHPSGSVTPTQSDIEVTNQLIEAGRVLGIDFLDHLIVTKKKFLSVMANGAENVQSP